MTQKSTKPRIHLADGQVIFFTRGDTLLQTLEKNGVDMHYQCRAGYCGACRTRLDKGEVKYLTSPLAWVDEGEILPCVCIPQGDIEVSFD